MFRQNNKNQKEEQNGQGSRYSKIRGSLSVGLSAAQPNDFLLGFTPFNPTYQTGTTIKDMDRMSFPIDQFYFKSQDEMVRAFDYCPEAIKNTIEIAERCNLKLDSGHVAQMATFRNRRAKGAIRDAGRAFDMSYKEIKQVVSLIPKKSNITIKEAVEIEPRLSGLSESSPQIRELLEIAGTLEGLVSHAL